jgi:DNA (cytosine-5)-methyltransferase 1
MKVASLFCGVGGLDFGFHKNPNFEHVFANDFNKSACKTYEEYFKFKPTCGDIKKITEIPDHDVLLFGFPCQSYSVAGNRKLDDPRGQLYLEAVRVLKEKQPKFFICENVPGLLSIGGFETPKDKRNKTGIIFKKILKSFEDVGYKTKWKLFELKEYGIPQMRRRVIVVGVRAELNLEPEFPEPTGPLRTLRDAIGDLPLELDESINHVVFKVPPSVKEGRWMCHRQTYWDRPSYTLTTSSPTENHPSMKRRMTLREYARIQTFPDDMIFHGSKSAILQQLGNAVPAGFSVLLANMLANYNNDSKNI